MKTVVLELVAGIPKFSLQTNEVDPVPDKYDIVLKVKACAISRPNLKVLTEIFRKNPRDRYAVGYDVSGIVYQTGASVTNVKVGDAVVGVVAIDSRFSGCGEFCLMSEYDVVKKPEHLSFEEAAAGIGDCVKAYTALFYQARVCGGDTILVIDGATSFGSIVIQLASQWGAKVIATASTQEEKSCLENMQPAVAQVIDIGQRSNILVSSVMEETGGVGVDIVVDNGVRMFTDEDDQRIIEDKFKYPRPHKHDVMSCLGTSGKWITSQFDLQLDPPDSQQLFLRGGSVNFLFEHIWTLSYAQHGRFQHILHDVINKLDKHQLKVKVSNVVTIDEAVESLKTLEDERTGRVVIKIS